MALFPHVRLARTKEAECDACGAMDIELQDANFSEERRAEIRGLKATHINEAKAQGKLLDAKLPKKPRSTKTNSILRVDPGQKSLQSYISQDAKSDK